MDRHNLLIAYPQRLSARREHSESRCKLQDLCHLRCSREELFKVIEHQQQVPLSQVLYEALFCGLARKLREMQGLDYRWDDQIGVFERGQGDEGDAICELGSQVSRHLHRHPCLADPTWPGQGHQTHVLTL